MLLSRLLGFFRRRGSEADLEADIHAHLDHLASEHQRQGMSVEEARAAARRAFGNLEPMKEAYRDQRGFAAIDALVQDVRYALRILRRSPSFTAIAVLTLALGIGANTAIFSVLDAIAIRPLPVRQPERLFLLKARPSYAVSLPMLRELASRQTAAEGLYGSSRHRIRELLIDGRPATSAVDTLLVSGDYFRLLGADAYIGRVLAGDDDQPSSPPAAVISHAFWRREFDSRHDVLGRTLRIDGRVTATIAGVTRPEFFGDTIGQAPDVWIPITLITQIDSPEAAEPSTVWIGPVVRLKPGVSREQTEAALSALYKQLTLDGFGPQWKNVTDYRVELLPGNRGRGALHEEFARPLWILLGVVGIVTLLACCNLANLLLARSTARTHEMGVRVALGGTRGRLIRQLLTESLVLTALGAGVALAVAPMASQSLVALAAAGQRLTLPVDVSWRTAGFTAFVSICTVLVFGLVPALSAAAVRVNAALQGSRRTSTTGPSRRFTVKAFLVAQVVLSLVLVAGAGLLVRSFWNLTHQDFGYLPERVLTAHLDFDSPNFKLVMSRPFRDQLYDAVTTIPGVRSAALSSAGPMRNITGDASIALPERAPRDSDQVFPLHVSPRYFETMGIPIVSGRPLTEGDVAGRPRVAVISETAARTFFGSADPVGRYFTNGKQFDAARSIQIVGIAKDLRYTNPREDFKSLVFLPMSQVRGFSPPDIVLQASGGQMISIELLRKTVRNVSPGVDIGVVQMLSDEVIERLRKERLLAWLSGAFGVLALMLASVGLYGVVAYSVELRTQEIGIRVALGATRDAVQRLLFGDVVPLLGMGLFLGAAGALAVGRLLESFLFGLSPHDPVTLISAAVMLSAAAIAAGYVPARRAGRLDPMTALRQE
jgi:predicted permease